MKTSLGISHPCASPSTARHLRCKGLQHARLGLSCPRQHQNTTLLLVSEHLCLQLLQTLPPPFRKCLLFLQRWIRSP